MSELMYKVAKRPNALHFETILLVGFKPVASITEEYKKLQKHIYRVFSYKCDIVSWVLIR